jgi:maltoporin|tara:strand:- start:1790 stop:2188 length:399 start_codon:yes stop_codon:yes gene_type:complete
MASYRVREGSITASDSFTNLGSLYGQATTSSVQVPAGASAIVGMIVGVSHDSATNGAATFAVQLTGDGLTEQQTLTVGSAGVDGTPASNGMTNLPFKCDVAIPVTASNQVSIAGAMDADIGTAQMSVCLIFA